MHPLAPIDFLGISIIFTPMLSTSTLQRKKDQKIFHVTFLSHWSDIESSDGEKDTVKWFGGSVGAEEYVGYRGNIYLLLPETT